MGATCVNPAEANAAKIENMTELYKQKRLPHIDLDAYRTEFERDFFMIVNLLRENPMSFQNYVKNFVSSGKFNGQATAANTLNLRLKSLPQLDPITPHNAASNACYLNLTKNEGNVSNISGNAIAELKLTEAQVVIDFRCFDTYKKNWVGTALELVLTLLLVFYERM